MAEELKKAFEQAAAENYWSDADSVSGPGSNMAETRVIRKAIPELLNKYKIKTFLDAPCGDLFWMSTILPDLAEAGVQYNGADIVQNLIAKHSGRYAETNAVFYELDLTKDPVPPVDLIFTRDCFIHLSYENIYAILRNYRRSGAKYLLTNTYTKESRENINVDGFFLWGRMLNMEKFPFYFGKPKELIVEGCTWGDGNFDDKSLGLWELKEISLTKMKFAMFLSIALSLGTKIYKKTRHLAGRVKRFIQHWLQTAKILTQFIISYIALRLTKKKVGTCLVQAHFLNAGGTRTYFFSLIEFLSTHGYEIIVIMERGQMDDDIAELQKNYPFKPVFKTMYFQQYSFGAKRFSKQNIRQLIYELKLLMPVWGLMRRYKCDTCIISEATPELWLFIFLSPIKVFYTLHSVPLISLDFFKSKLLNISLSKKKQLVTVSEFSKNKIIENWTKGRNRQYVKVIYNFYKPHDLPKRLGTHNLKKVLTIGTVDFYKNPLLWIDVCTKVSSRYDGVVQFTWAGDGPLLEDCRIKCRDLENVQFMGVQKNVEELYADCDIYYQPSMLESQGIAVLGAMCFEKACVVSDQQGLPESVINNVTGLIVPVNDPSFSVEALLSLLNDVERAADFGQAGKKRFESEFNKSKWTKQMEEFLDFKAEEQGNSSTLS